MCCFKRLGSRTGSAVVEGTRTDRADACDPELRIAGVAARACGEHALESLSQSCSRSLDDAVPLESRARIDLVGLDVVMAQQACVAGELVVGKLGADKGSRRISRIVAPDLWKERAERGRQADQGIVLAIGEIELAQALTLDRSDNGLVAGRTEIDRP